ncbi:MAG: hypothetical protein ACP5MG_13205 [Verrucomicrobiia bacterium]|jgi:hypothetical protein
MLKTKLLVAGIVLTIAELGYAAGFEETFDRNPYQNGWSAYGNSNLFVWNNSILYVKWDSSNPNSYFYKPLGTTLTAQHRFGFGFDIYLTNVLAGTTPGKPFTFQLAIGLINFTNATSPGFFRGTGIDSPNVVEFDYFPDSGFGATISPTIISVSNEFATSFNFPLELTTNVLFRVNMDYDPIQGKLTTLITSNGAPFAPITDVYLGTNFSGFFVDTFAICVYTDEGQDPMWSGSITAKGFVDNISFYWTHPAAPQLAANLDKTLPRYQISFQSQSMWWYTLERSEDLKTWLPVLPPMPGTGSLMTLSDAAPPQERAFYRVKAEKLQ